MGFVRVTLSVLAALGTSVALAASAAPAPPFKNHFPDSNGWAFTCLCGELACSEQDPIVDYCVVYNARTIRANTRAVLFALKTMVTGREPKFVVGFGLDGVKGATRGQALAGGAALDLPLCAEPFCYTPATADHVAALAGASKVEGRVYFALSSFSAGFDGAGAKDLLRKLITLPQHN